ncbi:MAG: alpha/beta fold hydrolase [Solirubrobacterales bacterium]
MDPLSAQPRLEESHVWVDGVRVFVRRLPGDGPPAVFVHGNPTHSEDWLPFLERMRGPALAFDLPGWGASDTPRPREFDYTMHGLARFVTRLLDTLGVDRYRLVVHDWGVVGLIAALQAPERVERLVIFNNVPLLPGYRWHSIARYGWRVPVVGEMTNLLTRGWTLWLVSRLGSRFVLLNRELVGRVWRHWRRGFWRPMLILYRSGDPEALAAAGARLGELRCPALVIAAHRDPYTSGRFGLAYAERLPNAETVELDDAGHWPWIDRPDMIDRAVEFLEAAD